MSWKTAADRVQRSPQIVVDLAAGGTIIGLPLSIAAYWIALLLVENDHRKANPKL